MVVERMAKSSLRKLVRTGRSADKEDMGDTVLFDDDRVSEPFPVLVAGNLEDVG